LSLQHRLQLQVYGQPVTVRRWSDGQSEKWQLHQHCHNIPKTAINSPKHTAPPALAAHFPATFASINVGLGLELGVGTGRVFCSVVLVSSGGGVAIGNVVVVYVTSGCGPPGRTHVQVEVGHTSVLVKVTVWPVQCTDLGQVVIVMISVLVLVLVALV
jgi:hypothetical protein